MLQFNHNQNNMETRNQSNQSNPNQQFSPMPDNQSSQSTDTWHALLNRVTTTSKILATIVFVALPFVGGYVGYLYAPEKVVEVPVMISTENESERQSQNNLNSIDGTSVTNDMMIEQVSEEMPCRELSEIETILSSFDTNSEQFWRRSVFEYGDGCTKTEFENGNVLYSMSSGCDFCVKKIFKSQEGYQILNPYSKLFNNLIVTVNDRNIEVLDVRTNQSKTVVELSENEVDKTFLAGEVGSSKFDYDDSTNSISVSVFDKNTCEAGLGGCYYSEIESDIRVIKL